MILTKYSDRVTALAPAKLNLFLEVLARRDDGYHELETLMVAITIFDAIEISATVENRLRLTCETAIGERGRELSKGDDTRLMGDVPGGDDNLVIRALRRLREAAGVKQGATVKLTKRIPSAAGLGGASSDAAAALGAANIVWNLRWPCSELARLSAGLGSDIPFFFGTGAAVCRGRGEQVESVQFPASVHLVVVRPPEGLSTARVYERCVAADRRMPISPLIHAFSSGDLGGVGKHLVNRLEPAAEKLTPWIARMRSVFGRLDCLGHQMSGSGTSYFGICRHAGHARRMAARLRGEELGYVTVATTFSTPRQIPVLASES